MKIISSYITAIVGFFYFTNLIPQLTVLQALEINKEESINIDYLKNFPENEYILGIGDEISIIVSREYPELNTTVIISEDGTVYLPKLNKVFISGLNLKELTSLLNRAFLKFVKYPDVEIIINDYRPLSVLVEGEVARSRIYILKGRMQTSEISLIDSDSSINKNSISSSIETNYFPTVYDAIRASGGITDYADLTRVEITRQNNISNKRVKKKAILNLLKAGSEDINNQNIRIYSGDIIRVPKRDEESSDPMFNLIRSTLNPEYIEITMAGKIEFPGKKQLPPKSTLNNAIQISGGVKVLPGRIKIIRFNDNATVKTYKLRHNKKAFPGSNNNPYLKTGDMVFIDKSFVNNTTEIISQITSPFTGIFSVYGLLKAISD